MSYNDDVNGYYGGNVISITASPRKLHSMETIAEFQE